MNKDVTVVIQAGGKSSRMGRDKALVQLGDRTLIEHIVDVVGNLGDELLLVTNSPARYAYFGLRMVSDATPGAGALPGLETALTAATGPYVLVVACDMPFLNRALLLHQLQIAIEQPVDVVVPRWADRLQTMHAVYLRDPALAAVQSALADGQQKMVSFYPAVRVHIVEPDVVASYDPDGRTFFNINTPQDLAHAETLLGR